MENCWFTSHSRGLTISPQKSSARLTCCESGLLGRCPTSAWHAVTLSTNGSRLHNSYYQPLVYCYNHHLSSQTCMKLLHDFCHLVWLTSWFLNNTFFFSNLPSYILIVFAGLLWLCHLVWLHLLVKAAAVPYIRTQRAAFEIQRSAWAAVNWALSMGSQCVQQSLTLLRLLAEQPRWIYKATARDKCLFEYCMLVEAIKLQIWTI